MCIRDSYTIKVANKNIIPGEKVTLKVVGTAASATNFMAGQNFYGTLTVDVTACLLYTSRCV